MPARMRLISGLVLSLMVIVPTVSSAQTAEELRARIDTLLQQIRALQGQIAASQNESLPTQATFVTGGNCPALSRSLTVGARGNDVTALQVFLASQGVFGEEATGYFGPLTEAAVKKIQAMHGVVSSGDAASTGYGAVGPKTRALIGSLCAAQQSTQTNTGSAATSPAPQCAQATSPTMPIATCGGTWEKLYNLGCHIGWRCNLPAILGNKPPVITAIDGPTTIASNSFGSWHIQAADPEGGALTYQVTWGDEGFQDVLNAIAGLGGAFTSSAAHTHAYAKAGTYTLRVTAKDPAGAISVAVLSVMVNAAASEGSANAGTPFDPFTSAPTSAPSCVTPWGGQVVVSGSSVSWQPFFTEGAYYATSSPVMKCVSGGWEKCDVAGGSCQAYVHATSTPETAALPSYTTQIGSTCSPEGSTRKVQVPPGTQLCQWLTCRITTQVETLTLKCTHSGWTDYANY